MCVRLGSVVRTSPDEDWERVKAAAGDARAEKIQIDRRWDFDVLKIVPTEWRRELLELVIGSHDPRLQEDVNQYMPVKVFNLSITQPEVIDATHERMARCYHPDGGTWTRPDMPRTVMVFINEQPGLTPSQRSAAARGGQGCAGRVLDGARGNARSVEGRARRKQRHHR